MAGEMGGGLVGAILGGPSISAGFTHSSANSSSHAESYSSSWGRRDIGASMMQNVNDRTHQHAHSNRSRRASVVKEVSQSEHESVSTRVICNYNHMHALTVQYYEVVQIYQVEVQLAKAEKVLFLPVALIDFGDETQIKRYQQVLAAAALSREMASAIRNLGVIEIAPEKNTSLTGLGVTLDQFVKEAVFARPLAVAAMQAASQATVKPVADDKADAALTAASVRKIVSEELAVAARVEAAVTKPFQLSTAVNAAQQINEKIWASDQVSSIAGLLSFAVLRAGSNAIHLPTDVWIEDAMVSTSGASLSLALHLVGGATVSDVSPGNPISVTKVSRIGVKGLNSGGQVDVTVTLTLNRAGVRFPIELPSVRIAKGFSGETRIVKFTPGGVNANVVEHLKANRLHYSRAVLRSLDASQIAALLAGLSVKVGAEMLPVAQVVDPKPLRIVGNYLVFRMGVDGRIDENWPRWLKERGIELGSSNVDVVPLATGGTFAEAVLGRANSAEKLDITRFWNWSDSPIPLQPTEIAAIQTGTRATHEDVAPGQLSTPIVNMMSPTTVPDPTAMAGVLSAIQNGGMFRDMSGLQGTIGLAQAALQATAAGASTAGQQAGTNMQNHLAAQTERMRIAADLAKSAIAAYAGMPSKDSGSGAKSHSQDGAKINYFDKTQGAAGAPDQGQAGSASSGASTGSGLAGASSGGGEIGSASTAGYSQNPGILSATWGDSEAPSRFVNSLVDKLGLTGGETPESGAVALGHASKFWPKLDRQRVTDRLRVLAADADAFNQGKVGLCTAAAFFHHVIQRNAPKFTQFANALYGAGVGYLGELKVRAGFDLRHADYAALAARHPPFPPEADWMLMSALRDSENWIFDFDGDPDDEDIETSARELSEWYEETKLYSSVSFTDDQSIAAIKQLKKQPDNHVALWIRTNMIAPGQQTGHMITIESPISINNSTNVISFDYWTWGQAKPYPTLSMQLSAFAQDYFGAITAKF